MRRCIGRLAAFSTVLLASISAAQAAEIAWSKSFETAMSDAKRSNRLVMADFYTDW